MTEALDFRFQVLGTLCRVTYSSFTRLDVDAIVNQDDVYLSMSAGLSALIRKAAGETPRRDARKYPLPLPAGSVVVTGAGDLRARHLLHALLLDYDRQQRIELLLPHMAQRVLEISAALKIERLAVPILLAHDSGGHEIVTQLARLPEADALDLLLRSVACFLTQRPEAPPLREFIVALSLQKEPDSDLPDGVRRALAGVEQQIADWDRATQPLNARLALLRPLLALADDEPELRRGIEAQIAADLRDLAAIFACPGAPAMPGDTPELAPQSQEEFDRLSERLQTLLNDLGDELNDLIAVERASKRRLALLQQRRAQQGYDTPPEVLTEIDEIGATLREHERQIADNRAQQERAQQQLETLRQRWQRRS